MSTSPLKYSFLQLTDENFSINLVAQPAQPGTTGLVATGSEFFVKTNVVEEWFINRSLFVFDNSMFKYVSATGGTIITITIITVRLVGRGVRERVFPTLQGLPFRDRS